MNDKNTQADLIAAIEQLASVATEMRTGQLIAAVGELCTDLHGRGLWDASDLELLEAVWQFRRNYEEALTSAREHSQEDCDNTPLTH